MLFLKRLIDITVSAMALILLFPLLVLIALLIRLTSPGPAIFCQHRLGKNGLPFTLYKYRTMYVGTPPLRARDGSNIIQADDPRITPLGSRLRQYSLDELPQLFNVLKGDMSLIGPRPDETTHIFQYSSEDIKKLKVKPGLTGMAVIKGRNAIPWKERIRWDVWYVDHLSPALDTEIFLMTIPVLLFGQDVYTVNALIGNVKQNS